MNTVPSQVLSNYLTTTDFAALSPLLVVLGGALGVLLLESFAEKGSKKYSFYLTLLVLAASLFAAFIAPKSENSLLLPWLRFDSLARVLTIFFLAIGVGATLLTAPFFRNYTSSRGEYYFLLLSALFGLILIGDSADFLTLFLGLETLSISLYILVGYIKKWKISHEAAIKYFLTGSLAAAFLLYGIALIYGAIGTTQFDDLLPGYRAITTSSNTVLFMIGASLVTLGLAFKATIVPFHVWAPDVYEGSPTPVTAFMAVGTKLGAFAGFMRVFLDGLPGFNPLWNEGIALLAFPTLIYANAVAIRQIQLRRFFAYSGISHAGFLLIPLAAGTADAIPAMLFYLAVYSVATLGAFAVLGILDRRSEGVMMHDLHGLFYQSPLLAGILTLCLLTLAGIPPTVGFFAKFYIFKLAFEAHYIALAIVGLLTTILSAYYYLKIVATLFSTMPAEAKAPVRSRSAYVVGVVALIALLIFSCLPAPLTDLLAGISLTTK